MEPLTITALAKVGQSILARVWPDPKAQAEAQLKLAELEQKGDIAELQAHLEGMLGQLEINKTEAQHPSIFVSGWRPAVGWVCVISLFFIYVPKALFLSGTWLAQSIMLLNEATDITKITLPIYPDLGVSDLIGLLMSMLGIGIMRSVDKVKNVDTKRIG